MLSNNVQPASTASASAIEGMRESSVIGSEAGGEVMSCVSNRALLLFALLTPVLSESDNAHMLITSRQSFCIITGALGTE